MKQVKTIERKIEKHGISIKKFKADNTLDPQKRKQAIFKLKMLIRQLKWVLN